MRREKTCQESVESRRELNHGMVNYRSNFKRLSSCDRTVSGNVRMNINRQG